PLALGGLVGGGDRAGDVVLARLLHVGQVAAVERGDDRHGCPAVAPLLGAPDVRSPALRPLAELPHRPPPVAQLSHQSCALASYSASGRATFPASLDWHRPASRMVAPLGARDAGAGCRQQRTRRSTKSGRGRAGSGSRARSSSTCAGCSRTAGSPPAT